jgi:anthranilate synthase component 1
MKRSDSIQISIPGDRFTPFSLAKKLGALAVLESASFAHGKARYSIILIDEAFRLIQDNSGVYFVIDGKKKNCNETNMVSDIQNPDILHVLEYVASQNAVKSEEIPLPGAGIGYLSYEFCARCNTIHLQAQKDELLIPESAFIVGHLYIVFDHFTETIHIYGLNYAEHEIDLDCAVKNIQKRLSDLDFSYLALPSKNEKCIVVTDVEASKKEYIEKVIALKKHIISGDIVQAVPSRRLQLDCDVEALEVYRRLRSINPSPYMFYLDFGDYQLVGASPESVVRVKDRKACIHPIAGTRRRGKTTDEDEKMKEELLADPKEKAEHLMLVDLARNDLGRVCTTGTVNVKSFMQPELYSHVIHLVSEVNGTIEKNKTPLDVLRSAFPAGTVSGAPKISAIEILSKLEKSKRNFYAGATGYISCSGDLDFCIAIRCALKQNNIWTLQAGGGIVHGSDPEREWEETNEKLGSMRAVLEENITKNA